MEIVEAVSDLKPTKVLEIDNNFLFTFSKVLQIHTPLKNEPLPPGDVEKLLLQRKQENEFWEQYIEKSKDAEKDSQVLE